MMKVTTSTSEQGGARLKLIIVIAIIAAVAYAGSLYIPVAYHAYLFKDLMQQKVDMAAAIGHPPAWVQTQLQKSAADYDVPADAQIEPTQQDGRLEVRVQFTQPIEFPGYVYNYNFDHTARSTDFLTK
jgi:Ca2+/H+ antiporter